MMLDAGVFPDVVLELRRKWVVVKRILDAISNAKTKIPGILKECNQRRVWWLHFAVKMVVGLKPGSFINHTQKREGTILNYELTIV